MGNRKHTIYLLIQAASGDYTSPQKPKSTGQNNQRIRNVFSTSSFTALNQLSLYKEIFKHYYKFHKQS